MVESAEEKAAFMMLPRGTSADTIQAKEPSLLLWEWEEVQEMLLEKRH
jgi:hypothetical protein